MSWGMVIELLGARHATNKSDLSKPDIPFSLDPL